jgi:hypothetical protein
MLLVVASFAGFAFAFAGCGSSNNNSATDTTATTTATTTPTTTETTTETTSTETTPATTTTAASDITSAANCQEFAQLGSQISSAFTGSDPASVQKTKDFLDQLAAKAPAEIKSDFQTLADAYGKIADALQGYDASSGQAPSAAVIAKLTALSSQIDTQALTTASTNIATWASTNCTG